jgi:hypothetical protein
MRWIMKEPLFIRLDCDAKSRPLPWKQHNSKTRASCNDPLLIPRSGTIAYPIMSSLGNLSLQRGPVT